MTRARAIHRLGVFAASAALAAACGKVAGNEATRSARVVPSALQVACGRQIVLQTDWYPEPEHGASYQLIGPNGRVDHQRGTYRGEISRTGVELEIRAGGPYIGNQTVSALMYQDQSIFMGYVSTDEAVKLSGKLPTVGLFNPLDKSPLALTWDPARYHFSTIQDIGRSPAKVLHYESSTFVDYLVGKGLLRRDQLDPSYDGSPSRFVARGDLVQVAFATSEPYQYEHDITQWHRPVSFLLVSTTGFEPYPESVAVRPETLREKAACVRLLVPLMQHAAVDYLRDPGPVNGALLRTVEALASPWTLTDGGMRDANAKMVDLGIVANGWDGMGSFDMERIGRMIRLLQPIYAAQKITTVKPDLRPEDIATNRFIDHDISR